MKIKLIINGCENPEDYKLLKTTISTVASLRKTAVLRFNSERLVIISTPKSASNSTSTILHGDSGQLWCTIPQDVFKQFTVLSVRDSNAITMEYNCDTLLSVFKRYDKIMNQGSFSDMTIKLQAMPEWNSNVAASSGNTTGAKPNPIVALGITFGEILHTASEEDGIGQSEGRIAEGFGSCKTITHSFKVPVKLMFKAQDARIQEPMVNYTQLMMYRLPPYSGEFGAGFSSFIKRVERYTNVNHIRLSAIKKRDLLENECHQLKIRVNDLDWQLEICWNGPLDAVIQQNTPSQSSENGKLPERLNNNRGSEEEEEEDDSMRIEESTIIGAKNATSNSLSEEDVQLADVSAMVEQAERDNAQAHEVMIKSKDWKVCHKLYGAFEEVVLAISHNESCVLHCSLDRGILDESEDIDKPKERGQIIYYIARSKPI